MKVLLVNPSQEKAYGRKVMPAYPPLGLIYIGTILKNDHHQVRLVDIDTEKISEQSFKNILNNFDPDAIGVTSLTPTFKNALKWAELAKRLKKNTPIIFGGTHATIAPEETIKQSFIDIVVVGEGELTARELFNRLSTRGNSLQDIKGIYFKNENKIIANERRSLISDLDTLPFPDFTLLKNATAFKPPDAKHSPVATIMSSRGCPGNCTFCCSKQVFTRRFRSRSAENIADEVESLMKKEGIREIHFADDSFSTNKKRVLKFCDEIKRRKINVEFQFLAGLRADCVDRDILGALKDIGVKVIGFGVESGNEEILKNVKKYIPLSTTLNAFKLSKEVGLDTWAFLVFGLPGETEETMKETIKFTKKLDPDYAKFLILSPYPGSEVYKQLDRDGLILSKDYDNYGVYTKPVHKLPGITTERMIYWQNRAYREFYLRPCKIISHLKRINSLIRFKLLMHDIIFIMFYMFGGNKK